MMKTVSVREFIGGNYYDVNRRFDEYWDFVTRIKANQSDAIQWYLDACDPTTDEIPVRVDYWKTP